MIAFIDASVILAALGSKSGGSNLILKLIRQKKIIGITSQAVLEEVLRNAYKIKVTDREVSCVVSDSLIKVISAPTSAEVEKYISYTAVKDAHVLAAAKKSAAEVVITLDKKHLLSKKIKGLSILTPGEFLKNL